MTGAAAGGTGNTMVEGPWDDPPQPHGTLLGTLRWCWGGAYMITENGRM
jgi:hypothetical protein